MNPIKANMVAALADYPWSSYHHNALGIQDSLITPHKLYTELAETFTDRTKAYQRLFSELDLTKQNDFITTRTQNGEVLGSENFHSRVAKLLSRPTRLSTHGGDRKSERYKQNQAG